MKTVYFSEDDMCTTQKLQLTRVQDWFLANGWGVTNETQTADLVLSLSCNGWALLEQNSYDRIVKFQDSGVDKDRLVVFGCINDAHPEKVKALHTGKTISNNLIDEQLESLIPDCKVKWADIPHSSKFRTKEDYRVYDLSKRFINISAGCTFNCSFCTHKPGLGDRKSRTVESVIEQIEELLSSQEVKIIVLTGMETAYFGIEHGQTYPQLLKAVLELSDTYEVHIAQFNPIGIHRYYDELLPLLQNKRVTDIQLPYQTTSKRLLKMMRRPEYSEEIGSFISQVQAKNNRAVWRTDLIVGWPTETQDELDHSLAFAVKHFDEIATYAIELSPDLPAWKYQDKSFSREELNRRVAYSKQFITKHGKMAHCGQQDDSTMAEVEKQRLKMRQERLSSIQIVEI